MTTITPTEKWLAIFNGKVIWATQQWRIFEFGSKPSGHVVNTCCVQNWTLRNCANTATKNETKVWRQDTIVSGMANFDAFVQMKYEIVQMVVRCKARISHILKMACRQCLIAIYPFSIGFDLFAMRHTVYHATEVKKEANSVEQMRLRCIICSCLNRSQRVLAERNIWWKKNNNLHTKHQTNIAVHQMHLNVVRALLLLDMKLKCTTYLPYIFISSRGCITGDVLNAAYISIAKMHSLNRHVQKFITKAQSIAISCSIQISSGWGWGIQTFNSIFA